MIHSAEKTLYACECHGSCLPRSCAIRGITAHVPHTSDICSLRGNVEDFERGSPKRFHWLCRFSVSDSGPFWTSRIGYATQDTQQSAVPSVWLAKRLAIIAFWK